MDSPDCLLLLLSISVFFTFSFFFFYTFSCRFRYKPLKSADRNSRAYKKNKKKNKKRHGVSGEPLTLNDMTENHVDSFGRFNTTPQMRCIRVARKGEKLRVLRLVHSA